MSHLWEGLFFGGKVAKFNKVSDGTGAGGSPIESIGVSNDIVLDADATADLRAGDIIFLTGFSVTANNGLKTVASVTTDTVTVDQTLTTEATVPSGAVLRHVGFEFATGDADILRTPGSLPQMTTTTKDFTELGLRAGEFIFIGGDDNGASGDAYDAAANNGFARVQAIAANALTFDKTSGGADGETEMVTEADAGKDIRIFFGDIIRNVSATGSEFDRKSYHVERTLGLPNPVGASTQIQSEVLTGAIVNEFALNIAQADKVTTDWTFAATDNLQRDGLNPGAGGGDERVLSATTGSVVPIATATAYNTSSDFTRVKMAIVRTDSKRCGRTRCSHTVVRFRDRLNVEC